MLYYFFMQDSDQSLRHTLAAVQMYSIPDSEICKDTYNTTNICTYLGDDGIRIINAKWICKVIAMILFMQHSNAQGVGMGSQYFLLEDMSLGRVERGTHINELDDD